MANNTSELCRNISAQLAAERQGLDLRIIFVTYIGSAVGLLSVACNIVLISCLFRSFSQRRHGSSQVYLLALAASDIVVAFLYITLIAAGILKDHFEILPINTFWMVTFSYQFTTAKCAQSSQVFIALAATIDTAISMKDPTAQPSIRKRILLLCISVVCGVVFRSLTFWETTVGFNEECQGFAQYYIDLAPLSLRDDYFFYKTYIEPFIGVYIPFSAICILRLLVMVRTRRSMRESIATRNLADRLRSVDETIMKGLDARKDFESQSEMIKNNLRQFQDAAQTTAVIVTTYILSNTVNLITSFLEQTNQDLLDNNFEAYTIASDTSSFLVILMGALRLPLYYRANHTIRNEVKIALRSLCPKFCCGCNRHKKKGSDRRKKLESIQTAPSHCNGSSVLIVVEGPSVVMSEDDEIYNTITFKPVANGTSNTGQGNNNSESVSARLIYDAKESVL